MFIAFLFALSRQEIMRPISRSFSDPHGYRALYFDVGLSPEDQESEEQEVVISDEEEVKTPGSPRERSSPKYELVPFHSDRNYPLVSYVDVSLACHTFFQSRIVLQETLLP